MTSPTETMSSFPITSESIDKVFAVVAVINPVQFEHEETALLTFALRTFKDKIFENSLHSFKGDIVRARSTAFGYLFAHRLLRETITGWTPPADSLQDVVLRFRTCTSLPEKKQLPVMVERLALTRSWRKYLLGPSRAHTTICWENFLKMRPAGVLKYYC